MDRLGHASVSASATPISIFLGTAIIYVAFKIPGMLFSEAVSASLGAVNRDVTNTTKSIISSAKTVAAITGIT
ncbi:hypothetical protein KSC_027820 [Ktedonobacter sp. SOSP1-52]|nr:hypothetical protein KSC_027820 [Ktedonobacter sp. SOSP1-52]